MKSLFRQTVLPLEIFSPIILIAMVLILSITQPYQNYSTSHVLKETTGNSIVKYSTTFYQF